jgi:hypothetical protein
MATLYSVIVKRIIGHVNDRAFGFNTCVVAGVLAGIVATLVEIPMWLLAGDPWWETLVRDTRFTAAIVLGPSALVDAGTSTVALLLIASAIHFALSVVYAIVFGAIVRRASRRSTLVFGVLFGLALYVVNLYGFTHAFPWFVQARGWVTLAAHLAFGATLARVFTRLA